MQGARVQSLVGELSSHVPCSEAKKIKKKKKKRHCSFVPSSRAHLKARQKSRICTVLLFQLLANWTTILITRIFTSCSKVLLAEIAFCAFRLRLCSSLSTPISALKRQPESKEMLQGSSEVRQALLYLRDLKQETDWLGLSFLNKCEKYKYLPI